MQSFGSSVPGVPAVASGRRVVMPGLPSADIRLVTVTARDWCSSLQWIVWLPLIKRLTLNHLTFHFL